MTTVDTAGTACREALASLAPLFSWPDAEISAHLDRAAAKTSRTDAAAARALDRFAGEIRLLDPVEREITYTATFDLAPTCSPYLGVHLFGDESRDRARLMVGLRSSYDAKGLDPGGELPDHVALVLSFAPRFDEDEWSDLMRLVLEPALSKMQQALEDSSNPYLHLVSASRHLGRAAMKQGGNA